MSVREGGTSVGGLTLVITWLRTGRGVASMGLGQPEVSFGKPLELQHNFAQSGEVKMLVFDTVVSKGVAPPWMFARRRR